MTNTTIKSKGTVTTVIRDCDTYDYFGLAFERIDNRKHSNSKKVFVDFNTRDNTIVYGYDGFATRDQVESYIHWMDIKSNVHDKNEIATCHQGSKIAIFHTLGIEEMITRCDNGYIISRMDSTKIFEELKNDSITDIEFGSVLSKNSRVEEEDCLNKRQEQYMNNNNDDLPFIPNTITITSKIPNSDRLDRFNTDDEFIMNIRKSLDIKYCKEICDGNLILYVKFPKSTQFEKIEGVDVIGTQHKINELVLDIYRVEEDFTTKNITTDSIIHLKRNQYLAKYKTSYVYFNTNDDSAKVRYQVCLKEKDKNIRHVFTIYQYEIDKTYVDTIKDKIIGKSFENYAGFYPNIGNTFINSKPCDGDQLKKRSMPGNKQYRCVFEIHDKTQLQLKGHKATFTFNNNSQLLKLCYHMGSIYQKYYKNAKDEFGIIINTDDISCEDFMILGNNKINKVSYHKEDTGVIYVLKVGERLYKFGKILNKTKDFDRLKNYYDNSEYKKLCDNFKNQTLYDKDHMYFCFLKFKVKQVSIVEEKIKMKIMNNKNDFITYEAKGGSSNIREYFSPNCNVTDIHPKVLSVINESIEECMYDIYE